ncbi:hypothetical protein [Streptomyces hydrogenans]|uniref:hypothetical protein n=1 Tax=Streptomyces hydrogenans TaxID=1873719 RepID=UPI0035DD10E4
MATDRRSEILDHIKAENGLTRVTMAWVRNRYDTSWDKLSRRRADGIAAWFSAEGIVHQPAELPSRETEYVTLYSQHTNIGALMAAARGEGFFKGNPEAALMILKGCASWLAERESQSADENQTIK